MAKITANNIFASSITSDKLDSSVASGLATATNANTIATIASTVAAAAFSSANTISAILANTSTPIITSITIADSSYNALDDTAANTTGGFCIITGSGFVSTPTVVFGTTSAPAVSFISSTTLRVQIPALTAASYPVYVVNSNGGTAIRINGLTTSSFPAWGTAAALANTAANTVFSVSLSANSDSSIIYANTTSLPAGTTLAANGLFSGTVSIGTQTTYTFDVKATDVELQDATRTFSLTVTVTPPTRLYVSGRNDFGQLGLNDAEVRNMGPVQVGTGTDWNLVSFGYHNTLATKTNGTLWAWGRDNAGQLGQNTANINRSSPTQVGTGTNWNQISAGSSVFMATKTDNTLWLWGLNNYGQLGRNNQVNFSSPVQVGTDTTWSKITGEEQNMFAIKTDGTLWAWGKNDFGQLGRNDRVYRSSPIQVGTGTDWNQVAAHRNCISAIKTNGTLWTWGRNFYGQLGRNDTVNRSSPTQVGTGTDWSLVSNGKYHTTAIKTNGTLWLWGYNNYGQLGLNDRAHRSSPTQVGTATNWSLVDGGTYSSLAKKTDNTLWSWGYNSTGQLGLPDNNSRSSPVQVGSATNWNLINMGHYVLSGITSN
jgi:alpha-tubulin suppressor-like RCC1 family protein